MGYIFIIKYDGFLISQKTTFREGIKIDKNKQKNYRGVLKEINFIRHYIQKMLL